MKYFILFSMLIFVNAYGKGQTKKRNLDKGQNKQLIKHQLDKVKSNTLKKNYNKIDNNLFCLSNTHTNRKKLNHAHNTSKGHSFKKVKRISWVDKFNKPLKNVDISLNEIDNSNPSILKLQLSAIAKHGKARNLMGLSFDKVFYAISKESKHPSKPTALGEIIPYKEGENYFVDINISDLENGEYVLNTKIETSKIISNGRKKKKQKTIYFARISFEKIQIESAHLVVETEFNELGSRLSIDFSESYSDGGDLSSIVLNVYRDNELFNEYSLDLEVYSSVTWRFLAEGVWRFELVLTDSLGDTDLWTSEDITPEAYVPTLGYSMNQSETYPSIVEFDLTSSTVLGDDEFSFAVVIIEKDGEQIDYYIEKEIFQYNIPVRGEFSLAIYYETKNGEYAYEVTSLNYLDESIPDAKFLNYEYLYQDEYNSPYIYVYNFSNDEFLNQVKNVTYTLNSGEEKTAKYSFDEEYDVFNVYIDYTSFGEFETVINITLEDDTTIYPYKTNEVVPEYDLGEAVLSMNLYFSDDGKQLIWEVIEDDSSAGNYGHFTNFICEGLNETLGDTFYDASPNLSNTYELTRGIWNFTCFGETSTGLSSNSLDFTLISINQAPVGTFEIVSSEASGSKNVIITQDASDSDGYINSTKTILTLPSGDIIEYDFGLGEIEFTFWEAGVHSFSYQVQDDEGLWSEEISTTYTVVNEKPISSLAINVLSEDGKGVELIPDFSDSDGEVVRGVLSVAVPSGEIYTYEIVDSIEFEFWQPGNHIISYTVEDDFGTWSDSYSIEYFVPNNNPIPSFNLVLTDTSVKITPDFIDSDGVVVSGSISVTNPDGETTIFGYDSVIFIEANVTGTYSIVATATDDFGDSSTIEESFYLNAVNLDPVLTLSMNEFEYEQFEVIEFNAQDSYDPEGLDLQYSWNIDGEFSSDEAVYFGYLSEIGEHLVELIISDPSGLTASTTFNVTIIPADFSSATAKIKLSGLTDSNGSFMGEVNFDALQSYGGEGEISSYLWDFGDGESSESYKVSHSYEEAGEYQVTLTVTTSLGVSSSVSEVVVVSNPENPMEIESDRDLTIVGIEENIFNPIESSITISINEGALLESEFSIRLNDKTISENFSFINGELVGTISASEGSNFLEVDMYDENYNLVQTDLIFTSGSRTLTITTGDEANSIISNVPVNLKLSQLEKDYSFTSDDNGQLTISNMPDMNFSLTSFYNDLFAYSLGASNQNNYELTYESIEPELTTENAGLETGVSEWDVTDSTVTFFESEVPFVSIDASSDQQSMLSKSFVFSGEATHLKVSYKLINLNASHSFKVVIINYSTGENIVEYITELSDIHQIDKSIQVNNGDKVKIEFSIDTSSTSSLFDNPFNFMNAYGNDPLENTSAKIELYESVADMNILFTDLNNSVKRIGKKSFESIAGNYILSRLDFLSLGEYENDLNPIFLEVGIKNLKRNGIKLQLASAYLVGGNDEILLSLNTDDKAVLTDGVMPLNNEVINSDGDSINLYFNSITYPEEIETIEDYNSRVDRKSSTLSEFIPAFYISSENAKLIDLNSNVELKVMFQLIDESTSEIVQYSSFSRIFSSNRLLSRRDNIDHYLPNNPDSPDLGDYWVYHRYNNILNSLNNIENLDFEVGDITNINGANRTGELGINSGSFYEHVSHYNGRRFDTHFKHFNKKDQPKVKSNFIFDLINMLSVVEFKANFEKMLGTYSKNLNANSICVEGKKLSDVIENYSGHSDHAHVQLLDEYQNISNGLFYDIDKGTQGISIEGPKLVNENKYVEYDIDLNKNNELGSIIVFSNNDELYNEIFNSVSDDTYGSSLGNLYITRTNNANIKIRIKIDYLSTFLNDYKVYASEFMNKDTCVGDFVEFEELITNDCNLDGIEGDIAYLTSSGGYVSDYDYILYNNGDTDVSPRVHWNAFIENGARVCGDNTIVKKS